MKKNKSKKVRKVNLETAMLIGLNAFAVGMFLQKVLICGTSWLSTIGYLRQEEKMDEKITELKKISEPVISFIKENYNPHTAVIINEDSIKVVTDEINIPIINKF